MGNVAVARILDIWSFRLKMARSGKTHPSNHGLRLMEELVEKLGNFDPQELVEIKDGGDDGVIAQFVRVSTGEVFAQAYAEPGIDP